MFVRPCMLSLAMLLCDFMVLKTILPVLRAIACKSKITLLRSILFDFSAVIHKWQKCNIIRVSGLVMQPVPRGKPRSLATILTYTWEKPTVKKDVVVEEVEQCSKLVDKNFGSAIT